MNKESCLLYAGLSFRLEWYFDETGYSQPYEYFKELSDVQKRKFLLLVKKMGDFGKIYDTSKFRYEGDEIYAFKPQPNRFLCFFRKEKKIIVTNAFYKKTDKLPLQEKQQALIIKKKYEEREIN